MLTKKMNEALNHQLNMEASSAYIYLSMAGYFAAANLTGLAAWMKTQAGEEVKHAMKFFEFINDRGGRVALTSVEGPQTEWESPLAAFDAAYKHEQKVTAAINKLVDLARSENDHASEVFLAWFVNEQVEEEASTLAVVEKFKLAGDSAGTLLMLDHQLGKRE
jgi:ferritin